MKSYKSLSLGAAACVAIIGFSAVARGEEVATADIVVTALGVPQDRDTTGQSITVIDRAMIEDRQAVSIADLLATTPGVTFSRSGGPGSLAAVRVRGGEDRHTLTLINGVRINDPSSTGGAFDFGNLLSLTVDRVEVLRGPNSVPWGSDAIAGVVNISTAAPMEGLRARARAEYGYKDSATLSAAVSGSAGPVSASLSGGYFRDDGVSAFRFGSERDGYRQYAGSAQIAVALGPDAGLDLRGYYADSGRDIDGFPPPTFDFGDTDQYATSKELVGYAGGHLALADGAWRNRIGFTITDVDRENFASTRASSPSSVGRGAIRRAEYRGDADLAKGVRMVFGLEHMYSRYKDGVARYSTRSDSGFVQMVVTPVEQLTLTGGLRVDDYKTYGSDTTFAANAAWRPLAGTTLRASYAEGFKAPTLYQLFSEYGNDALQPEEARSYEVGIEQRLASGRVTLGATAFSRTTTNLIDYVSCFGSSASICGDGRFGYYQNVGRVRARGVETTVLLKPTDRLSFDANYSYLDAEDRGTGIPLLRRPAHSVSVSADWQALPDRLTLGATVQSVGNSFDNDYLTFARTRLDGYSLVTLRAALDVGEHLEIYGRVENLFDEDYVTVSGYGTFGRAAFIGIRTKL